jgi:hypothetical protein
LEEHPPDPYTPEPADRDPPPDWPDSDPRWDERWGLTFEDAIPQLDLRDFVVTAADLKALKAPPPDQMDAVLVPQEGGA